MAVSEWHDGLSLDARRRCSAFAILVSILQLAFPLVLVAQEAPSTTPEQLVAALPEVPEIERRGETVVWQSDGTVLTVAGVDPERGDVRTETAVGSVWIPRDLVENRRTDVLKALPALADKAKGAELAAQRFWLQDSPLTGSCLRNREAVVLAKGVLHKQEVETTDRQAQKTRITAAVAKLMEALPKTDFDEASRRAITNVLQRLDRPDQNEGMDEVHPSFARRMVRNGWLRLWCRNGVEAAAEAEQAVLAAEEIRPVYRFEGDGLRLEELRDAFGEGGWVFTTPAGVFYARREPRPLCHGLLIPNLTVVAELPVGADPIKSGDRVVAARIHDELGYLAGWSTKHGFSCDPQVWRGRIVTKAPDRVVHAIPPHILIAGLNGDIAGLAVEKGLLRPATDGSRAEAERFLADAARLLPGAAHIDLIGEFLFTYVYPSPDARYPWLVGTADLRGDVRQTVWQTCGNVAGGSMRGACFDLAELYQAVAERQGLHPVLMSLSGHGACAWAEKQNDRWHVFALQTGPALEFTDATLPGCLEKAYKSFDPQMAFDANGVPLLLRFSGEVAHQTFTLSWRIFSEPDYFRIMAEVQRDWHLHTYQRAIASMRKLIAAGDEDNANYRELSGLYSRTGQHEQAAEYQRKTIERASDPVGRLTMTVDLVSHLLEAGRKEEAEAAALDVLNRQLPALRDRLGPSAVQIGIHLGLACIHKDRDPALIPLATRILSKTVREPVQKMVSQLAQWVASDDFKPTEWEYAPHFRSQRRLIAEYCQAVIDLAETLGPEHLPDDADARAMFETVQQWFDTIAFRDTDMESGVMWHYHYLGRWMAATKGEAEFDRLLENAGPAHDPKVDHTQRKAGPELTNRDLSWIRASVTYWNHRLGQLFSLRRTTLDPAEAARLATRLEEARAATAKLGFSVPWLETTADLGDEMAALAAQDEPRLRQVLRRVGQKNDKGLQDRAAMTLGMAARLLDIDWYARVLNVWTEEVDHKPVYFSIAWNAAAGKAPRHALMTAKLAAERFKDDPAFRQEYDFMRALLDPAKP